MDNYVEIVTRMRSREYIMKQRKKTVPCPYVESILFSPDSGGHYSLLRSSLSSSNDINIKLENQAYTFGFRNAKMISSFPIENARIIWEYCVKHEFVFNIGDVTGVHQDKGK